MLKREYGVRTYSLHECIQPFDTLCEFPKKLFLFLLLQTLFREPTNKRITVAPCAPQADVNRSVEVRQSCTSARCVADAALANGCPGHVLAMSVTWQSFAGNSYLFACIGTSKWNLGLKETPMVLPQLLHRIVSHLAIIPSNRYHVTEMKQAFF